MATVRQSFNPISPMECSECGRYKIPVKGITEYGSLMVCSNIFCDESVYKYDIDNPVKLSNEMREAEDLWVEGNYNTTPPEPALKEMKENSVIQGEDSNEEDNDEPSGLMRFMEDNTPG